MLVDLRRVWSEDQYELIDLDLRNQNFYFGRYKGDQYQLFVRSGKAQRRRLLQSVSIENTEWNWDSKSKRLVQGEAGVFHAPVREEHVLEGYHWAPTVRKKGIEDLSQSCRVEKKTLPSGAHLVCLLPSKCEKWILSLHGGPESYEDCEIRYGGMYRDLLRKNVGIAILNYRGSSKLAAGVSMQAWKNWSMSIKQDFQEATVQFVKDERESKPFAILGASFGGALALILQEEFNVEVSVLLSPLLDLNHQIFRAPEYQKPWFESRFGGQDKIDFSFESLCNSKAGQRYVFYSYEDEVLGSEVFKRLEGIGAEGWALFRKNCPHAPVRYADMKARYAQVLQVLAV